VGFGLWRNVFQKLEKIPFEFFPQEAIKKGIEAIVEISYADGDRHCRIHYICNLAVMYDAQLDQHIQKGEDLVGDPGEEEKKHDCHNYFKYIIISWLVLLNLISLL
jgi:hypothetical protein